MRTAGQEDVCAATDVQKSDVQGVPFRLLDSQEEFIKPHVGEHENGSSEGASTEGMVHLIYR